MNDNALITNGQGQCLGYLFNFQGHGVFSPDGKVNVTSEQVDSHNAALSEAEINGLDKCCQVGQCGTFYYIKGNVQTFVGAVVSNQVEVNGKVIIFHRNGKTYRGRLQKDADCFNFKRIS